MGIKYRSAFNRTDDYDLTINYLMNIVKKQNYRCAYSNIPLIFDSNSSWNCSIERIDISKKYYTENVCFVCGEFNTTDRSFLNGIEEGSGWNKEKFKEYYDFLIENINKKFDTDCIFNHLINN